MKIFEFWSIDLELDVRFDSNSVTIKKYTQFAEENFLFAYGNDTGKILYIKLDFSL